ncbi:MAG: hypothetical protein M3417_04695 [Actinomycetota bacterium]|nr:hypothetical protein [Actinomycetota bacterium]
MAELEARGEVGAVVGEVTDEAVLRVAP